MAADGLKAVVTGQSINVRSGPGTNFSVITTAKQGDVHDVIVQQGDWVKISLAGQEAYVASSLVSISANPALLGFLGQKPDLLALPLVPDKTIPTTGLQGSDLATANLWNMYGGLVGKLSDMLNIPVSTVVGVMATESGRGAFASDGRMIIRFEVHLFYNQWGNTHTDIFNRYFSFDTSSPGNNFRNHMWRPSLDAQFSSPHTNQNSEWQALTFARTLDDTAALKSISMGAPQIVGFNYRTCGFESVQAMFDSFSHSATAQLLGLFDFVKGPGATSPAIQALQTNDYLAFARIYNGPANMQAYSTRIKGNADAFSSVIKTAAAATPAATNSRGPDDTPPPSGNVNVAPPGSGAQTVSPPPPPAGLPPMPPPAPVTPVVTTPPPAPTSPMPVLAATVEGLNVRSAATTSASVLQQLHLHETVTLLEPLDQAIAKMSKGKDGGEFVNIQTNAGNKGFVAAWLVERSTSLTRADMDTYINGISAGDFPIPPQVDQMWTLQDQLGLPDPFDVLPVQTKSDNALVNMMINGFGPNTSSSQHWPGYYSGTAGMHNGFDYIVPSGTPLNALSDGVIIKDWVFMGSPFEKTVVVWCFLPDRFKDAKGRRMMSNVLVAYAHTSDNSLKNQFDIVSAGDQIAISGVPRDKDKNTGQLVLETNNAHLHMEVHLLTGDNQLVNPRHLGARQLLTAYKHAQPFSNQTPWNPMLFFSKRLARYHLHQGKTIGYFGQPSYPTPGTLQSIGAGHLPPPDFFTLGYYEYGSGIVWQKPAGGGVWPPGVVTIDQLQARLQAFTPFVPYEATFLDK